MSTTTGRFGAGLAIALSLVLLVVTVARGVNVLSAWTVAAGLAGGSVGWRSQSLGGRLGAVGLLVLAGAPAVFSYGTAYLVSIIVIAASASRPAARRHAVPLGGCR